MLVLRESYISDFISLIFRYKYPNSSKIFLDGYFYMECSKKDLKYSAALRFIIDR